MTVEEFKQLFSEEVGANGFYLVPEEEVFCFRQPLSIWESKTDLTIDFNSIDDLLDYEYRGVSVRDRIAAVDSLQISLSGSAGSKEGEKTFKFNHASGGNGKDETKDLFPAYANTRIKSKSLEGAMQEFHERFKNEDHEWAYEVDEQGYVHQYKEGNATSVSISGRNKNNMILHNHPSGGAFSDSDLISVSLGNEKGIVASGKNGDYIFQKKGGHFKGAEFVKAVKRAKMSGTSYDDAVDKWLTANQKKYGYTYKFVKDTSGNTTRADGKIGMDGRKTTSRKKK